MKKVNLFFFLFPFIILSQEISIKGTIKDTDTDERLEAATIFVQKSLDSSLVAYTISNQYGNFELTFKNVDEKIRFLVSYNGYQTIEKYLDTSSEEIDLGIIKLKPFIFELNETEVIGEIPPILVKKDTLEFNASSFKLRLESTLEDLLKVLPGVDLEDNGNILVNGNRVSGIKVNGKSFFSSDTKIALKNLPIDIIDKVQVVDKKSELEEFIGTTGKTDEKEINVTIKKDNNKGVFGNFLAGIGDSQEYQLSGIANYFNDNQRLTILGGSNNIDNPGFTYDDLSELSSNARNLSWRGNLKGISSSNDAGANFSDEIGSKFEVVGEYFYSDVEVQNVDLVDREYFLPENSYKNRSESKQNFLDRGHRFDLDFTISPDTLTKISITPRIRLNNNNDIEMINGISSNLDGTPINQITTELLNEGNSNNIDLNGVFTRKFRKPGEYFSLKTSVNLENNNSKQEILNDVELFEDNGNTSSSITSQLIDQKLKVNEVETEFEIRKKIFKNTFIVPSLRVSNQDFFTDRTVLDKENSLVGTQIDRLSTVFDQKFSYWAPNLGIELNTDKINFSVFTGAYISRLKNNESNLMISRNSSFKDLFMDTFLSYKLSSREKLTFIYNTSISMPDQRYFLSVPNELDLTNIYIGNPFLNRIFRQDISLNYNNYNSKSKVGFFVFGKLTLFNDDLSIIRNTDDQLIRTISYTNTDGNIDGNFRISISKTKSLEKSRIRYHLGFNSRLYRRNNISNSSNYQIDRWSLYPTFRLNYNTDKIFSLQSSYSPRVVITKYTPGLFENTNILSHQVSLKTSINFPKNLILENDIEFNSRPDIGDGFENSNIFWNASIGYRILKEKGTIKLRYFDILNENVRNSRYTGEDYVQDSESSVLNRYLMLSFSYRVRNSKK